MCGIVGIVNNKAANFIETATEKISHRGPDGQGTFIHQNIALGHTRLSIIELSDLGSQPMVSDDGNFVLVYNGELYNHLDIRQKLVSKYNFKSNSDTETILYALIEFGEDIIKEFNGIFAFSFFNIKTGDLLVVRDHFGVKPLYYYHKEGTLLFGSEIKSMLNFDSFDKSIEPKALVNYLNFLWSPGELTPFKFVKKLLPGHLMKINTSQPDKLIIEKYYEIPFNGDYDKINENEAVELLEKKLFKAVERQLLSDVPVGFFLSGGLDSSAIVAISKKINPEKRIKCFTIDAGEEVAKEGFVNDLHYAKKLSMEMDLDLEVINAKSDILGDFDKMIYDLDEPQADPAPLNVLNICNSASQKGYKVLLGGTAGDDIFSGYRRHQALNYEKYFNVLKPFSGLIKGSLDMFDSNNAMIRRAKKLFAGIDFSKDDRMANYFSWLSLETNKGLFSDDIKSDIDDYLPATYLNNLSLIIPDEKNDLNKMLYWEMRSFLVDHNLNYTDKMSMAAGVETRVPFLDLDLVNFSTKIPPSLKMKGNTPKYILKKVMEKYLPNDIIYRPKTGFGAPIRTWINTDLQPMINDYLSVDSIKKRGVFKPSKVHELLKLNKEGKIDAAYPIFGLLAIESWFRQFVD